MDPSSLRALIDQVAAGDCTPDDAVRQLRRLPYADLGFARRDHPRDLPQGLPEAVYGPGKTPEQCAAIVAELLGATSGPVLLTRAADAQVKAVSALTMALGHGPGDITEAGPTSTVAFRAAPSRDGTVVVVTAGTADLPVAHECTAVLRALGFTPTVLVDCGVSGLHRLLAEVDQLA